MDEKEKEINEYIKRLFPECEVEIERDFYKKETIFRVDNPDGKIRHRISFGLGFLGDNTIDEILEKLNRWNLKRALYEAGKQVVFVTNEGLKI